MTSARSAPPEAYSTCCTYSPGTARAAGLIVVGRLSERILDDFRADLSTGIAAMVLAVDPELVVIGGGLSRGGPTLLGRIARHLAPLCVCPPELALSQLGDGSVALGAVRIALDLVEERLKEAVQYDTMLVGPDRTSVFPESRVGRP
ncbi:hypothetical protein P8605_15365 [Streptomyces sp. T-3]|nr:hypothetical protein [Streptomyces sp. T-3]